MESLIYQKDFVEMIDESARKELVFDTSGKVYQKATSGSFFFGDLHFSELGFDEIHIGYGDFRLLRDTVFHFDNTFESIQMHFALNGNTMTKAEGLGDAISFATGYHNLFYLNQTESAVSCSSKVPLQIFEVNISLSLFKKYIPEESAAFVRFREHLISKRTAIFNALHNYPITTAMNHIIHEIMGCTRQGVFKRLFLESKVVALLLLQLEQIFASNDSRNFHKVLNNAIVEKLDVIKQHCEKNLESLDSLSNLAKTIGINEYLLKIGFKQLFGTSVYAYWKKLRLETAKKLLVEEGLSVREVAESIGYKHSHHFADAFKKEFGFLPSKIKR